MEWYRLKAAGIKDSIIGRLMKELENYQDIFLLDRNQLKKYFKIDDETVNIIYESRNADFSEKFKKL